MAYYYHEELFSPTRSLFTSRLSLTLMVCANHFVSLPTVIRLIHFILSGQIGFLIKVIKKMVLRYCCYIDLCYVHILIKILLSTYQTLCICFLTHSVCKQYHLVCVCVITETAWRARQPSHILPEPFITVSAPNVSRVKKQRA